MGLLPRDDLAITTFSPTQGHHFSNLRYNRATESSTLDGKHTLLRSCNPRHFCTLEDRCRCSRPVYSRNESVSMVMLRHTSHVLTHHLDMEHGQSLRCTTAILISNRVGNFKRGLFTIMFGRGLHMPGSLSRFSDWRTMIRGSHPHMAICPNGMEGIFFPFQVLPQQRSPFLVVLHRIENGACGNGVSFPLRPYLPTRPNSDDHSNTTSACRFCTHHGLRFFEFSR